MSVRSSGDGGIYLGASSQYPGSIASVYVDMSGTGNIVVATSNGRQVCFCGTGMFAPSFYILHLPDKANGHMKTKQSSDLSHSGVQHPPSCMGALMMWERSYTTRVPAM